MFIYLQVQYRYKYGLSFKTSCFCYVAEECLARLEDQLSRRRKQLQDASDKLTRTQQAIKDQVEISCVYTDVRLQLQSELSHARFVTIN